MGVKNIYCDNCARIAPCINDSMIHDNSILNPMISMYLVSKNHRDIDTVTNATRYIRIGLCGRRGTSATWWTVEALGIDALKLGT